MGPKKENGAARVGSSIIGIRLPTYSVGVAASRLPPSAEEGAGEWGSPCDASLSEGTRLPGEPTVRLEVSVPEATNVAFQLT